jgi:hypothetical protein
MDLLEAGARLDREANASMDLRASGSALAEKRCLRPSMGESVNLHPEVLTQSQKTVLAASATVSRGWNAYLAGGAALALQLGHRRSVDFDWFTRDTLRPVDVLKDVRSLGMPVQVRQNDAGTFLAQVGGVDYSVFRYRYELVGRPVGYGGCQLASLKDIAAMKMTAIVQRATKRDYVDLHALLQSRSVTLSEVVSTMQRKYPGVDQRLALRAMTYFDDVERQPMPDMIAKISWDEVKRGLVLARDRGLRRGPSR